MHEHILSINIAHLQEGINRNFFEFRDVFYRCLIAALWSHNNPNAHTGTQIAIDDQSYNQLLHELLHYSGYTALSHCLTTTQAISVYQDLSVYLQEFIEQRQRSDRYNIYCVDIVPGHKLIVKNKQFAGRTL